MSLKSNRVNDRKMLENMVRNGKQQQREMGAKERRGQTVDRSKEITGFTYHIC